MLIKPWKEDIDGMIMKKALTTRGNYSLEKGAGRRKNFPIALMYQV